MKVSKEDMDALKMDKFILQQLNGHALQLAHLGHQAHINGVLKKLGLPENEQYTFKEDGTVLKHEPVESEEVKVDNAKDDSQ